MIIQKNKLYFIEGPNNAVSKVDPSNNYEGAPGTFVLNLEAGDEYFGLGFGRVDGVPQVAVSNVSDGELEVYNINTGTQINSKNVGIGARGVTFNDGWDVYICGPPTKKNKQV